MAHGLPIKYVGLKGRVPLIKYELRIQQGQKNEVVSAIPVRYPLRVCLTPVSCKRLYSIYFAQLVWSSA